MSATGPITAVVFDLGGVLIDWNPRYLYRDLFAGDDDAMERFLAEVVSPAWNHEQDAGRTWAEGVAQLVAIHPERRDLIEAYWRRWPETLGDALDQTVEVLDALRRRGMRLIALTNWSSETFPIARARYPFLDWFEGIVVSGDEGVAKPDPRLFRILLERYGLEPGSTLLIDDMAANCAAAAGLGMQTIRFTGAAALRMALEERSLLDPA